MMKLLTFTIFAVLLYSTYQQTCTLVYQKQLKQDFSNFIGGLNETQYNVTDFNTKFQKFMTRAQVCYGDLQKLVTTKAVVRAIKTTRCLYNKVTDKAKFDKDPCCSRKLAQTQCCVKRSVNGTFVGLDAFKAAIDTRCAHPNAAKKLARRFIRTFPRRISECQNAAEEDIVEQFSLIEEMGECFTTLFSKPSDCVTDADCNQFSNGTCSLDTNKCNYGDVTNPNPLLDCVFSKLPGGVKRAFINKLGLKNSDGTGKFRDAFKQLAAPTLCVKPDGTVDETKTTKAACEATKVCNVPKTQVQQCTPQAIPARCYSNCNSLNGVCTSKIPLNENLCASAGLCLGHGILVPGTNTPFDKATCQNGTFKACSNYAECNTGCNATACAATSKCLGAPNFDICIYPFTIDDKSERKTCAQGQIRFKDIGCYKQGGTKAACEAAGGRWLKQIKTKAECEAFKVCFNSKDRRFSLRSPAQCTACGYSEIPIFKWAQAIWGKSPFIQRQKVVVPAEVPQNKFVRVLNLKKLTTFFTKAIEFSLFPIYKTYAQCLFAPSMPVLEAFACDCQSGRTHNTSSCYPNIITAIAGTFKTFSGLEQTFKQFGYGLTVKNNSITKDNVNLYVKTHIQENIKTQAYYDMFNIFFKNAAETGVVVSQGQSVATADGSNLNSPVNLCIEIDQDISVPTGYNTLAFATVDASGNVIKSSIKITNTDTSTEICGDVSDSSKVYYAAKFGTTATNSPNPTKSPTNPPASSAGTFFLAALAVVFSVLGYLF